MSGGYRKRIALATALLSEPDLLLMDEPTNHLDAASVEWLQGYLQTHRGAVFLVTHDRYFLDRVTNRIIELDRADIYTYDGNYAYYLEKKALREEAEIGQQRKHRNLLRRELEWLQRGAKARSTKQKARIDRATELQNREFKASNGNVEIDTVSRRIGKKVIEIRDATKSFGDRTLFEDFSYTFEAGDRVGIVGGNGAGKSTLLNAITGQISLDAGEIEIASKPIHSMSERDATTFRRTGLGIVFQSFNLIPTLTASENVELPGLLAGDDKSWLKDRSTELLDLLGLADRGKHRPEAMSGGERQRVMVARALAQEPQQWRRSSNGSQR